MDEHNLQLQSKETSKEVTALHVLYVLPVHQNLHLRNDQPIHFHLISIWFPFPWLRAPQFWPFLTHAPPSHEDGGATPDCGRPGTSWYVSQRLWIPNHQWQDMARYGKIWQDMARYGKIWQDMAGGTVVLDFGNIGNIDHIIGCRSDQCPPCPAHSRASQNSVFLAGENTKSSLPKWSEMCVKIDFRMICWDETVMEMSNQSLCSDSLLHSGGPPPGRSTTCSSWTRMEMKASNSSGTEPPIHASVTLPLTPWNTVRKWTVRNCVLSTPSACQAVQVAPGLL